MSLVDRIFPKAELPAPGNGGAEDRAAATRRTATRPGARPRPSRTPPAGRRRQEGATQVMGAVSATPGRAPDPGVAPAARALGNPSALSERMAGAGPDLDARRQHLAEELAELQWDLGGLTYEMAIRDHFRLDVLVRRAARLQEVDAELGEVERLQHLEGAAAAGSCPNCGALRSRGAVFCWQCGAELMARTPAG